jgi:hypothetical protein
MKKTSRFLIVALFGVFLILISPVQPSFAATYDHFDNGFQVGSGNTWLPYVDDPFQTGSFNGDGIMSVSGSFLHSNIGPYSIGSQSHVPISSVYGFTGRLSSPTFSDNFLMQLQFNNFNVSDTYFMNSPYGYKQPNLSFGFSYASGYSIRLARFQLIFYSPPGVIAPPHTEDWFVIVRSEGMTPGGPGPANNVLWQPVLRAYSASGTMALVRDGSLVEAWASDGPGDLTKVYTFGLPEYAYPTPLFMGLGVQGYSGGGSFQVDVDWVNRSAVPGPATMLLLASGLVGLAGLRRKFKMN